ncbi:GerAB/ArcD/ProY family transporter [Geosporobacter ferrireducens]|uniref:Uncharacterized protein n=1 Tax=Geosporobacter ferrireducens TaxID=1424294 RepID=A0A1D8GHC0_9FIRM|nr:endospore germination permease [Geosporobacter ferrireducens]AOT70298.1 hypothetical protein Gferi_12265 [Geosporobacter ferrireducens]MTI54265.1 hypothetical protein [Geosporobacter ferrireducens]
MSKEVINIIQLRAIIITTIIGIGVISLPRTIAVEAGTASWLALLIATLLIIASKLIILKILEYFPDQNIRDIAFILTGKGIGTIVTLMYILYFLLFTIGTVSFTATAVNTWMLPLTPIFVLLFIILGVTAFLALQGVEGVARFCTTLLIFNVGSVVMVTIASIPYIKIFHIQPVFHTDFIHLSKGVGSSFLSFFGGEVLFIFYKYTQNKNKIKSMVVKSLTFVGLLYTGLVTLTIGFFGIDQLKILIYPVISLFKSLHLRLIIPERLELVFLMLWMAAASTTIGVFFFSCCYLIKQLIPKLKFGYIVLMVSLVCLTTGAYIPNIEVIIKFLDFIGYFGIIPVVIIPLALLIIIYLKRWFYDAKARNSPNNS